MAVDHPSLHWLGEKQPNFEFMPRGNAALEMFTSLDRHAICSYVATLHGGISCQISPQFTHRSTHLVIELGISDNVFWVARLSTWRRDGHDKSMESEIAVMNLVRSRTSIPVPKVYAWDSISQNVFQTPFILMQAVNGKKLSLMTPVYEKFKGKILDQMASILMELSTIQSTSIGDFEALNRLKSPFDKKGFKTATEYYDYYLNKHLQGVEPIQPDERDVYVAENRRCRRLVRQFHRNNGPFPLTILPFGQSSKILVDDEGTIVALTDWTRVGAYPWEVFAQFPEVIHISLLYCRNYSDRRWRTKLEGQRCFMEALQKYELQRNLPGIVSSLIASDAKIVVEGVLTIERGFLRNRWMKILERIERKKRERGFVPGPITFDEIRRMWGDLDRMQALVLRQKA